MDSHGTKIVNAHNHCRSLDSLYDSLSAKTDFLVEHREGTQAQKQQLQAILEALDRQGKTIKDVHNHCRTLDGRYDSLSAKTDVLVEQQDVCETRQILESMERTEHVNFLEELF